MSAGFAVYPVGFFMYQVPVIGGNDGHDIGITPCCTDIGITPCCTGVLKASVGMYVFSVVSIDRHGIGMA